LKGHSSLNAFFVTSITDPLSFFLLSAAEKELFFNLEDLNALSVMRFSFSDQRGGCGLQCRVPERFGWPNTAILLIYTASRECVLHKYRQIKIFS
jgi:hypothetical protein